MQDQTEEKKTEAAEPVNPIDFEKMLSTKIEEKKDDTAYSFYFHDPMFTNYVAPSEEI